MISLEQKQILEGLAVTQHGQALLTFLNEEYEALNDVTTIESWDETLGRKNAVKILDKLFSFMGEKKNIKKNKNPYT